MIEYYVLDIECTGLSATYHEIHELSLIRFKDKHQLTRDVSCWYPERANLDALKLTPKTHSDLRNGISKDTLATQVDDFLNQDGKSSNARCIIAYNGSFDRRFVHAHWKQLKKQFQADLWIDPLQMVRYLSKSQNLGKVKNDLTSACDRLSIVKTASHKASGDTRRLYYLYEKLINEFNIDHLSYIKTFKHEVEPAKKEEEDMSVMDDIDFSF